MGDIKICSHQRLIGSIVGLVLGVILINLYLPKIIIYLSVVLLNISVVFFIPRNYAIANFFTNPQILLLSTLNSTSVNLLIVRYRLLTTLTGVFIVLILMYLFDYGLYLFQKNNTKNHHFTA